MSLVQRCYVTPKLSAMTIKILANICQLCNAAMSCPYNKNDAYATFAAPRYRAGAQRACRHRSLRFSRLLELSGLLRLLGLFELLGLSRLLWSWVI
jgi:hypothetical protein